MNENDLPLDPISCERMAPNSIWTSQTIAIRKHLYTTLNALNMVWMKGLRQEGEIPHPYWNCNMTLEEKEGFIRDIALLMGVEDEKIRDCWKWDDELLTTLAAERLTINKPNWKQESRAKKICALLSEKQKARHILPQKRLSLLSTYWVLYQEPDAV